MWKTAIAGAAALLVAGTAASYAQQQPGNPNTSPGPRDGQGMHRHLTPQDMNAFADARIAALHAGLALKADQEKNWGPFEQALRDLAKMRIARMTERQQQGANPQPSQQPSQTPANPIERLQKRADAMATRGAALKKLADAAGPLYQSLDDAQKQRFTMLARFMRPHGPHRAMWREHGGMRGEFRDHRLGDNGMRGMNGMNGNRDGDGDYRGPL
jgi:zinc resistance-associated protein